MRDRRHILTGLAALPAAAVMPGAGAVDPLAALWAEFQALRATLYATARSDADWTAAQGMLSRLEGQALDVPAVGIDGAAAAVAWARDEYAFRMDGVADLDTGERLIFAMLDTALTALRSRTAPHARRA